ncbi:hypothetical protein D3C75_1225710 [compost metagenome]
MLMGTPPAAGCHDVHARLQDLLMGDMRFEIARIGRRLEDFPQAARVGVNDKGDLGGAMRRSRARPGDRDVKIAAFGGGSCQ